jgi:hypothetical protein
MPVCCAGRGGGGALTAETLPLPHTQNGVGKISASGEQVGSVTKLRFTRFVAHPSHPISLRGDTNVNWAYGSGNDFSKHAERRVRRTCCSVLYYSRRRYVLRLSALLRCARRRCAPRYDAVLCASCAFTASADPAQLRHRQEVGAGSEGDPRCPRRDHVHCLGRAAAAGHSRRTVREECEARCAWHASVAAQYEHCGVSSLAVIVFGYCGTGTGRRSRHCGSSCIASFRRLASSSPSLASSWHCRLFPREATSRPRTTSSA